MSRAQLTSQKSHAPAETELDAQVSAKSFRRLVNKEQEGQVNAVYDAVESELQAQPHLKAWCTRTTLKRYLAARNWDTVAATKMLRATFEWRSSFKPHLITWDQVKEEAVSGKQYISSWKDRDGRPVIVMRPRNENTKPSDRQMRYLIYHFEILSRLADESGVVKMTWLIDFKGYSMRNAPPVKTQIQTTTILQNHYPERLGLAVCYHAPRLFSVAYRMVKPFIDPVTHQKVVFTDSEQGMAAKFDMSNLERCLGGTSDWTFSYEEYSQRMKQGENQPPNATQPALS